jgi:hypothetical protein
MRHFVQTAFIKFNKNLVANPAHGLWDKWAQTRFDDALDALVLQADQLALPVMPMKQLLHPIRANAETIVEEKTLLSVRKALIKPGNQAMAISIMLLIAKSVPT